MEREVFCSTESELFCFNNVWTDLFFFNNVSIVLF